MNNNNKNNQSLAVPYEIQIGEKGIQTVPAGTAAKNRQNVAQPAPASVPYTAPRKGFNTGIIYSIAGFVLGLISLVAIVILGFFALPLSALGPIALLPYGIGIVTCIVGMICSSIGKKSGEGENLAKAGLIMNIVPLVAICALILFTIVGIAAIVALFGKLFSSCAAACLFF